MTVKKVPAVTAAAKPAAAKPKAATALKAKPQSVRAEVIRAAIEQVESGNHAHGRDALLEQMVAAGAKFDDRDNAIHIDWHGIKMQTTAGLPNALTVWCNKARRAILSGEAA